MGLRSQSASHPLSSQPFPIGEFMRRLIPVALLCLTIACGKDASPTGPSAPPPPTTPPGPTLYTINGRVSSAAGGTLAGATVRVADGPNANKTTTTDGSGSYSLTGLTFAGFTVEASMGGFVTASRGGILQSGITTATANFTLLPATPWSMTGRGNSVFEMPSYVSRVRVTGVPRTTCENFIVRIGGRASIINVILGTCSIADARTYDGTHLTGGGGTVEIVSSTAIDWSFVEAR
jgi:hypothetical protein